MLKLKQLKIKYLKLLTQPLILLILIEINEVNGEIPSITNLATNASLNAKTNEVINKMPNVTNVATTTALTAVENKIPNVSNLVK